MKIKYDDPETPAPSERPRLSEQLGRRFVEAAEKTATAPVRGFRLLLGLDTPQSLDDYMVMTMMGTPAILAGGAALGGLATRAGAPAAVARAAPVVGRMATATGLKGTQEAMQGRSPIGVPVALAAGEAALGEAGGAVAGKALKHLARPAESLTEIMQRIPTWAKQRHLVNALEAIANAPNEVVKVERIREIVTWLNKIEPKLGQSLERLVLKATAQPVPGVRGVRIPITPRVAGAAQTGAAVATHPATRAAGEALLTQTPAGPLALFGLKELASHVVGRRRRAEEREGE